jgi:thermitase
MRKYSYRGVGRPIDLEADPRWVAVTLRQKELVEKLAHYKEFGPYESRLEVPQEKMTLMPVAGTPDPASQEAAQDILNNDPDVEYAGPVFEVGGNIAVTAPRLRVKLSSDAKDALAVLATLGFTSVTPIGNGRYLIQLPRNNDPFAAAEDLRQAADIDYAVPDFVLLSASLHPADSGTDLRLESTCVPPATSKQYFLDICGTRDAWQLPGVTGDPQVKIAILDSGVDPTHPDLADAFNDVSGNFAAGRIRDFTDNPSLPNPNPSDAHGTACAGLAVANGNGGTGIMGIGAGCSLLSARIAKSRQHGGVEQYADPANIARAIEWCVQQGARVLSMSWWHLDPAGEIEAALAAASNSVLVVSAGNRRGPPRFPATLDWSNVLVVAASNEFDELKGDFSHDGDFFWLSSFGPTVNIAAPGVHIYTTDIAGSNGYNDDSRFYPDIDGDVTPDNYYPLFSGTSAAAPLVAGAAGLLFSIRPSLTAAEVCGIIRSTADPLLIYPRNSDCRDNPPPADHSAPRRLNVLEAVHKALNNH